MHPWAYQFHNTCSAAAATISANAKGNEMKIGIKQRLSHKFQIGKPGGLSMVVCRRAFCQAYNVSHYLIDSIAKGMKCGQPYHIIRHAVAKRPQLSIEEVREMAAKHQLNLDEATLQAAVCPNSSQAFLCTTWMSEYFRTSGEPCLTPTERYCFPLTPVPFPHPNPHSPSPIPQPSQ